MWILKPNVVMNTASVFLPHVVFLSGNVHQLDTGNRQRDDRVYGAVQRPGERPRQFPDELRRLQLRHLYNVPLLYAGV